MRAELFNSPLPSPPQKTIVTYHDSCFANCVKTNDNLWGARKSLSVSRTQFNGINFIDLLLFWKKYHKEIEFITSQLCQVGPCKVIRDVLGIWIPLSGFGIPDSNRKRDSGFLKLHAVFHKKKIPGLRDTDYLTGGETIVFILYKNEVPLLVIPDVNTIVALGRWGECSSRPKQRW